MCVCVFVWERVSHGRMLYRWTDQCCPVRFISGAGYFPTILNATSNNLILNRKWMGLWQVMRSFFYPCKRSRLHIKCISYKLFYSKIILNKTLILDPKLFADPCCQGIDPKNKVFLDIQVIAFFEEWKSILGFDINVNSALDIHQSAFIFINHILILCEITLMQALM